MEALGTVVGNLTATMSVKDAEEACVGVVRSDSILNGMG